MILDWYCIIAVICDLRPVLRPDPAGAVPQMVPIKEMTDVMRVIKEQLVLKRGCWVRLKRGVFKDDIAQVDYVDAGQSSVHLKLVPRIDYSRMRGALRDKVRNGVHHRLLKEKIRAIWMTLHACQSGSVCR